MAPTAHTLSGRALHSGVVSTVTAARRAADGLGLRLFWHGFAGPLDLGGLARLRRSARRATILENGAGGVIRTPEHLLAAALFFVEADIDLRCDAAEPPGFDGSALPWFELLKQAAQRANEEAFVPRAAQYDCGLEWAYEGDEGVLKAEPAPEFSVEYVLERGGFRSAFTLKSLDEAPREVLPARTFIFHRDWKGLANAADLLAGTDADSGLLLAESEEEFREARSALPALRGREFPLLHPESARFPDEPARHKVLDLLGDLALRGPALPRLRLRVRNGGHALNHLLLERLQ